MRKSTVIYAIFCACLVWCVVCDPAFAVTVENLKEPIKALKKEIFGGWMFVLKIIILAVGVAFSAHHSSLGPLGIAVGIVLGIIFFDSYLGDGATGALV